MIDVQAHSSSAPNSVLCCFAHRIQTGKVVTLNEGNLEASQLLGNFQALCIV